MLFKRRKTIISIVCFLLASFGIALPLSEAPYDYNGEMQVHFIDVGQGVPVA